MPTFRKATARPFESPDFGTLRNRLEKLGIKQRFVVSKAGIPGHYAGLYLCHSCGGSFVSSHKSKMLPTQCQGCGYEDRFQQREALRALRAIGERMREGAYRTHENSLIQTGQEPLEQPITQQELDTWWQQEKERAEKQGGRILEELGTPESYEVQGETLQGSTQLRKAALKRGEWWYPSPMLGVMVDRPKPPRGRPRKTQPGDQRSQSRSKASSGGRRSSRTGSEKRGPTKPWVTLTVME